MTHKHIVFIRETAKFCSGLIVADMIMGIWIAVQNMYNLNFLGLMLTQQVVYGWILFDAILLIILFHYGWKINLRVPPANKTIFMVTGILLSIVALLHVFRLFFSVSIVFGTFVVPMWLSIIGALVTGFLGYASIKFALHK